MTEPKHRNHKNKKHGVVAKEMKEAEREKERRRMDEDDDDGVDGGVLYVDYDDESTKYI
jgi:hypothetical protein